MPTLLVDDHALFRESLACLLDSLHTGPEVAICGSGEEALQYLMHHECSLVLLDWNLGTGLHGVPLIQAVLALRPDCRVVVVSGNCEAGVVRQAIDAGALGFVSKEASSTDLLEAIRVTANGGIHLPADVLVSDPQGSGVSSPTPHALPPVQPVDSQEVSAAFPRLTPRQCDVLRCLVRGQSNKRIARDLDISDGTVKQHLAAIYRELNVQSRTEAVYLMARHGVRIA